LADRLVAAYQRFLRRPSLPGEAGCAMDPTCSRYARQSIAEHGAFVGIARTLSRLFFREATSERGVYQPVQARGAPCRYDPAR
jgi:putative component of membrane protein insertase Oxa1/YidC/SpoIIIJ protein YidD